MKTLNQFLEQGEPAQEPKKEDPKVKQAQAKENMLKKRVLMTKIRAVRGGAEGIMASHELEGEMVEGVMKMIKSVTSKKKSEKKAEKAMDAGARAKRKLARKVHAKYVSGSEDNVPDDIRESQIDERDYHIGQGEKIQKRTKKWMDKKGQSGAPGLNAMNARTAEHKAKRGVKNPNRLVEPRDGVDSAKEVNRATRKAAFRPFNKEDKAFDYVVAKLRKQHGNDAVLTKGQKPKPPTAAQKKKNDAIRAQRAKEDHRDETEKATSGRYNDRSRSD